MMDIADATIVTGVLDRLFDAGWILVATCNRTPDEFAKSMLHREHPQARFTERIREVCDTTNLIPPADDNSPDGKPLDYRAMLTAAVDQPALLSPLDCPSTEEALEGRFALALDGTQPTRTLAQVGPNRKIEVLGSKELGVCRVSFSQLCDTPLGATDYIALAQQFHTIFVTGVPQLSLKERDAARRFITLIDQLYNHKARFVATAEVPLTELFNGGSKKANIPAEFVENLEGLEFEGEAGKAAELNPIGVTANPLGEGGAKRLAESGRVGADSRKRLVRDSLFTGEDEVFAFRRALSRLTEMSSTQYLERSGDRRVLL